jgi:hypothetical protein
MERPKKYEKEDNIHITEADRVKRTMLNYMQASRALSIASPVSMTDDNNTTNHYDKQLELKQRHSSKKKHHRHSSRRQQQNMNQSSSTDDEENYRTVEEVDLLLTKEAYEAAEDLSFIANHMRSACRYEEVLSEETNGKLFLCFDILDS